MPVPALRIAVENFGPVARGEVDLRPLTVFIGPNNTGKSYVALLAYVLSKAVNPSGISGGYPWYWYRDVPRGVRSGAVSEDVIKDLERWLSTAGDVGDRPPQWRDLPRSVRGAARKSAVDRTSLVSDDFDQLFTDYFGIHRARDLIKAGVPNLTINTGMRQSDQAHPFLALNLNRSKGLWESGWNLPGIQSFLLEMPSRERIEAEIPFILSALTSQYWRKAVSHVGFPVGSAYYLPANRSGVLQAWQVFASMALDLTRRRAGLERIEVPAFTGVARDFLRILFGVFDHRTPRRMSSVLEIMESSILQGVVDVSPGSSAQPEMIYRSQAGSIPIHRSSSLVTELAPIYLWAKYVLRPGDLLIIDEPESHLHPEAQRRIATVLVRLVREGVRVICTTHSSTILHQLSNHLLAGNVSEHEREKLGFGAQDVLKFQELSVHHFALEENGTVIRSAEVDRDTGIDEEEFIRVMEDIGEETYLLSNTGR